MYGVPFHLFRQMPSSRQMQSPPHWLTHRPPTPPIFTGALFCGAEGEEVDERVAGAFEGLRAMVGVGAGGEVAGAAVLASDGPEMALEAELVLVELRDWTIGVVLPPGAPAPAAAVVAPAAAPASLPFLPIVAPRPAPRPTAMARSNEAAQATMKKVRLFKPRIFFLRTVSIPEPPLQAVPL